MGRNQHRFAHFIELDQQSQKALRHFPIDIASWLVCQDYFGRHDNSAGKCRALAFTHQIAAVAIAGLAEKVRPNQEDPLNLKRLHYGQPPTTAARYFQKQ